MSRNEQGKSENKWKKSKIKRKKNISTHLEPFWCFFVQFFIYFLRHFFLRFFFRFVVSSSSFFCMLISSYPFDLCMQVLRFLFLTSSFCSVSSQLCCFNSVLFFCAYSINNFVWISRQNKWKIGKYQQTAANRCVQLNNFFFFVVLMWFLVPHWLLLVLASRISNI